MAMDLEYVLYDTYVFGAAVSNGRLFQVAEGSDATHVTSFTNSRGAGIIPQSEKFVVQKIIAIVDFVPLIANVMKLTVASWVEFLVANRSLLKVPLAMLISNSAYSGAQQQAVAADLANIGMLGNGYDFMTHPILIDGGTQFVVSVNQGTAVAAASNVKFCLVGTLSIP